MPATPATAGPASKRPEYGCAHCNAVNLTFPSEVTEAFVPRMALAAFPLKTQKNLNNWLSVPVIVSG